ncbi:MAG: ATP-dependent Clp protease adaptor ClpS [Pseudomonadota bacterium]
MPGESRRRAAETGDPEVFDLNRDCLVAEGVKDIDLSETQVGERLATRLDNAYPLGSIDHWASRSYFMEIRGSIVCLNMGSPDVEADRALYDRIADSFVVIESPASIVMAHDGQTPSDFVVDVLVDVIGYVPRRATQRAVRLNTQRELVVALVDEAVAPSVVEQVNERSRQSGYSLTCRMM